MSSCTAQEILLDKTKARKLIESKLHLSRHWNFRVMPVHTVCDKHLIVDDGHIDGERSMVREALNRKGTFLSSEDIC